MSAFRRPGLRFLVEAVVIVLTAVVTGLEHFGAAGIGGAVAVVWVTVAVIEYSLSHPREPKEAAPLVETRPEPEPALSEAVRVIPRTTEPVAAETPVALESDPLVSELEPVLPEPVVPEPEAELEPVEARVWNVWEINRSLRDSGAVTEEQEFLLLYLRDYAGPDGSLPLDFDVLVRESFGDVLGTPAG